MVDISQARNNVLIFPLNTVNMLNLVTSTSVVVMKKAKLKL